MTRDRLSIEDLADRWYREYNERIPYKGSSRREAYDSIAESIKAAGYLYGEITTQHRNYIASLTSKDHFPRYKKHIADNMITLKGALIAAYEDPSEAPAPKEIKEVVEEKPDLVQEKYRQELDDIEDEEPIDPSEQVKPARKTLTPEEQEEIDFLLGWKK